MLRTLYLKSVRDKWVAATVGVAALFATALMGLWAYAGIGDEALAFFSSTPPAYQSLFGLSADAGVAGLMMANMFNFLGPFVLAGIAISMGASAIAGEERDGTMNVLAAVPRSRSQILWSKSAAMLTIVTASCTVAALSYAGSIYVTGTGGEGLRLLAATIHTVAVCVLYGALALAIGAITGKESLASGASTAFLLASFLGAGLLPLFAGWEDLAKLFPWYYLNSANPLVNGVKWSQIALVLGVSVGLLVLAWWGLRRRDLRAGIQRVTVLARLREDEHLAKALAALRGSAVTGGVSVKALSEGRVITTIAAGSLFVFFVAMGPLYRSVNDVVGELVASLPDALLSMVGFVDYSRPEGWYHGEGLSIVAPVAVAVVAISMGAALTREERNHTIWALLGSPVSRSYVAWRNGVAMLVMSAIVGAVAAAGIALGNFIAGLGMDYGNIAASGALLAGLGCVLGAVAFFAGGMSGRMRVATGAGIGVSILGWGVNAFLPINDSLEPWAKLSPFYYYASNYPLDNGMDWWRIAVLMGAAVALLAAGVWTYRRRDLHD